MQKQDVFASSFLADIIIRITIHIIHENKRSVKCN